MRGNPRDSGLDCETRCGGTPDDEPDPIDVPKLVRAMGVLVEVCELVLNRESYQGTGEPWPWLFDEVRAALTAAGYPQKGENR